MVPQDRRYTKTHEWVKIDGDMAVVGITDHAQDSLGDITFIEPPKPGASLTKGKECGVIESVKAASDLYSPISGTVAEVNATLESAPETVNKEPHGEGWLFKVKDFQQQDIDDLMDSGAYTQFVESEV
jgi:glycine cleavage system H protein